MARLSASGRPGPVESAPKRGDRATATFEDICHCAIPVLFYAGRYTIGGCAMWRMSNAKALIFVDAVIIGVPFLVSAVSIMISY